jgi:hypothetical protein
MRDPGVAAVLSAIIPGVGQFYNGRFLAGILWLIITPACGSVRVACSVGCATSSRPTPPTRTRVIMVGGLGNDRTPRLVETWPLTMRPAFCIVVHQ